ncbi:MAG: isopropylmalate isomerase, partial [Planctomycetes bacterium]|nr:isopropylmalate isomerase [Planctomycetota bacterium]
AFEDDRAQLKEQGKEHAFDQEKFTGANVLLVNSNFGCGSSREHAPQSLCKWGITALVGVSYAEIFFGNNIALGVPCLLVSAAEIEAMQTAVEADPSIEFTVDVENKEVRYGDVTVAARMDDGPQKMFLSGNWDATGQLIDGVDQVKECAAALPYMANFA